MDFRGPTVVLALLLTLSACDQVGSAVDQADTVRGKAAVCAEALGLVDLKPLVDPEKLRNRAEDKQRRLRELAGDVSDRDVKNALITLADSYVEVQKNRYEDLGVVTAWAKRHAKNLDALRTACV